MMKKNGFTLIELLIASLIGFIVTTTAIDLIFSSSKSSAMKNDISIIQQDGLFTSMLLVNDLYKAGDLDYGKSTFGREPFNWDKTGPDEDNFNDEIAILFYNHDSITNCSGDATIGILENHYEVKENILYCNEIEIIENVERLNIVYGVDITGDGNIDRFVKRDVAKIINEDVQKRIIAISFSLLLRSSDENGFQTKNEFQLANGDVAEYQDGKAYRLFKRTVLLRNML